MFAIGSKNQFFSVGVFAIGLKKCDVVMWNVG
jgi:hypothetical protein